MQHNRAEIAWPIVKLSIDDERDFYVEGDTISGSVLLATQQPELCVHSISITLMCIERIKLPLCGAKEVTSKRKAIDLLEDNQECLPGGHYFAYSMAIPRDYGYYPPSLEVDGAPECGIRWALRASAIIEAHEKVRMTVEDVLQVQIFQLPSEQEVLTVGDKFSGEQSHGDISCTLRLPRWFPQAPDLCDIVLGVKLKTPALIHCVEVYLEKCVIMCRCTESKVLMHRELVESILVKKEIKSLELSGASRQWQLKGPLAGPFCSMHFRLQYNIAIVVDIPGKRKETFRWPNMLVSSPAVHKNEELSEETVNEAPPLYSEAVQRN